MGQHPARLILPAYAVSAAGGLVGVFSGATAWLAIAIFWFGGPVVVGVLVAIGMWNSGKGVAADTQAESIRSLDALEADRRMDAAPVAAPAPRKAGFGASRGM